MLENPRRLTRPLPRQITMEDRKPDPAASQDGDTKNNTITVRVRDQTGEETFFKVKKVTRMEKVFATYASRKGVSKEALRFLLDGDRINPEQTPDELGLEDQDMIDCVLEQVGGCCCYC
ncbi:unnamed protein product [Chrysoparadoxa australica]